MARICSRTISGISTYAFSVVTSPATCTKPVVTMVSTATRAEQSCSSRASRIESEMRSQILSGCPSVTDSDVNSCRFVLSVTYRTLPRASDTYCVPYGICNNCLRSSGFVHDFPRGGQDRDRRFDNPKSDNDAHLVNLQQVGALALRLLARIFKD